MTEQLVLARARAKVTHIYLEHGLVDEARTALARLIEDLGDGLIAETNGGGSDMAPTVRPQAVKKTRPKAAARPTTNGTGKRPTYTDEEKAAGAARGHEIGAHKASKELSVSYYLVRQWMASYPADGKPVATRGPGAGAEQRRRASAASAI